MSSNISFFPSLKAENNKDFFSNHNILYKTSTNNIFVGKTVLSNLNRGHIVINSTNDVVPDFSMSPPVCASPITTFDLLKIVNINKLQKMASFEEDWNGTGAMAFSKESITLFTEIINKVKHQPYIAPTGRNSLYIEYKSDDNSSLSFEVRETSVEKLTIPYGDFSLAKVEKIYMNLVECVCESAENFYE